MRRWFDRLPIHRKLVTSALLITAVALALAMAGLSLFDVWRHRASAAADAGSMASVLAENTAAAVMFREGEQAAETLRSLRVRAVVTRACIYLVDGSLFASYARAGAPRCPATQPPDLEGWSGVVGSAPVSRNERSHGLVFVERDLSDLRQRLLAAALVSLLMFALAASAAYVLAQRVNAAISRPIAALAEYARAFGHGQASAPPQIATAPDELGDLVTSFGDMVTRVIRASDDLQLSNEALRREQAEREAALGREREANRLKDEFLAAVSHELRTPLNAMVGWAQVLATTQPNEETIRKAVSSILRNAQAQTRVIDDLLDVSRIVTGKLRLAFAPIDLRAVVGSATESMEQAAAARGVRIERLAPPTPCLVAGDRDRLQQILWNLISNAVKFTPSGGVVSVRLACDAGRVRLAVRDTGIGISPEFLPHVFDRFRQADGSLTREHGGLGLGLAIVKELTELHGGTVSVASDGRERGASFLVDLPELQAHGLQGRAEYHDAGGLVPRLDGLNVFAVDDNDDAVAIMTASLTRAGAQVFAFTQPVDALAAWLRQPGDVLVCDLAMPRMSGVELLRRIREHDAARGAFAPAIAVSAHASEQHRNESLRGGFQAHMPKPIEQDTLVRAVADAVACT